MIVGEHPPAPGVEQRIDAVIPVHHVHNLAGTGVIADRAEDQVAAEVFLEALADDVLSLGIESAHGLHAVGILVGGVHKAFIVHVNAGKLCGNKQLLLGALFLGGELPPEFFPQAYFHADGAEEAGKIAFCCEHHDALEHVLGHAVHAVRIVHGYLERGKDIALIEHLALRVLNILDKRAVELEHDNAVVLGIRHIQLPVLGNGDAGGRRKGLRRSVCLKMINHLEHIFQSAVNHNDPVVSRVGEIDLSVRGHAQILRGAERAERASLPHEAGSPETPVRDIRRRRIEDIVPVVIVVAVIRKRIIRQRTGRQQAQEKQTAYDCFHSHALL